MGLRDAARNLLAAGLGMGRHRQKMRPEDVSALLKEPARVLIVRTNQGLGDLLLATPVLKALHDRFPKAELHFLAEQYNHPALLNNPRIERLWIWRKRSTKNLFWFLPFIRSLRKQNFDLAILLSSNMPSFTSFLLVKAAGAKRLWSYDTRPFYRGARWSEHLADVVIPVGSPEEPEHAKFWRLLEPLIGPMPRDAAPEFVPTSDDKKWARNQWESLGVSSKREKVVFFLGGNPDRPDRLWTPSQWADLVQRAADRFEVVALVPPARLRSGSNAREHGFYQAVRDKSGVPLKAVSDPSLGRIAAFLQGADAFVCPDGGLFHVAIASRVRTLGLFFGTDPARWVPPVEWAATIRPENGVPAHLSPEQVALALSDRLAGATKNAKPKPTRAI